MSLPKCLVSQPMALHPASNWFTGWAGITAGTMQAMPRAMDSAKVVDWPV